MLGKIAIAWISLACVARGRRLQGPTEQLRKSSSSETLQLLEARRARQAHDRASGKDGLKPSKALAALLRISDAAAAFSPSGSGIIGRLPAALHSRSGLRNRAPAIDMEVEFQDAWAKPGPKIKVAKPGSNRSTAIKFDRDGNLIPNLGDIVKYPGKWEGEYEVGQVDFLQAVGKEGQTVECELIPMREVRPNLWAVPRGGQRPKIVRVAISEVTKLKPPYIKEQDAYNITLVRDTEVKEWKPPDPEVLAQGLAEYEELKKELVKLASVLAVAGTLIGTVGYGPETGFAYFAGAITSIFYLILLETNIDTLGGTGPDPVRALSNLRFLFPLFGFGLLVVKALYFSEKAPGSIFGMVLTKSQIPPLVLGFLTYKAGLALINVRTLWDAVNEEDSDELSAETAAFGSVGLIAKASRRAAQQAELQKKNPAAAATFTTSKPLVVICGPSESSNTRILSRLLSDSPDKYGITVACTTRPQSPNEVNGSDFTFLSDEQFDGMVAKGEFIEYSEIGEHKYGNSIAGVQSVWETGLACVMDLAIEDVPAIKKRPEFRTFVVWVPPEQKEGSEERRGRMIDLAKQMDTFDKVLDSSESEKSYKDLQDALQQRLAESRDTKGGLFYNLKKR